MTHTNGLTTFLLPLCIVGYQFSLFRRLPIINTKSIIFIEDGDVNVELGVVQVSTLVNTVRIVCKLKNGFDYVEERTRIKRFMGTCGNYAAGLKKLEATGERFKPVPSIEQG